MRHFSNSINWDDVEVYRGEDVLHGHRINVENMSDAERDSLLKELDEKDIVYAVRRATVDSKTVKAGDKTVRVIEPKSVENLRYLYFGWAKQGNGCDRPIIEKISEYERRQEIKRNQEKPTTEIDRETAAKLISFAFMLVENEGFKTASKESEKSVIHSENVARAMKILTDNSQSLNLKLTGNSDHWTKESAVLQNIGKGDDDLRKMLAKAIQSKLVKSGKEY